MEGGFADKDQYDAVTKHKWKDLATYKEAMSYKFDIEEKQFYEKIKSEPQFKIYWNQMVSLSYGRI